MQVLASLSLSPGPGAVTQALAWLESVAEQQHWHPRTAFKLCLCLDETLTNVVLYGFSNDNGAAGAPAAIDLAILADDASVALDIVDNGVAFDPTQPTPKDLAKSLDEADIGGHGLRLIRHYLNDIQYRREQGRNHLRLITTFDSGKT